MTGPSGGGNELSCATALAALARGGEATDWDAVEQHLASCVDCGAGLALLTAAVDEQFAASDSLADLSQPAPAAEQPKVVPFPDRRAERRPRPTPARDRKWWRHRWLAAAGAAAAAVLVVAVVTLGRSQSGGGSTAEADRRPEFVTSLNVLPERPGNTYFSGELVQVCVGIKQPSRIHLTVLEGHSTMVLYDADSDPGQHCFPERVSALRAPATLRVEVFYGKERVAREDFTLRPATPTP